MKKFLSYILTFLVLFVITVAATVSLSSGGGSGSIYPIGGEQTSASSVFSSLLAAFQDNQQFNISGKLCIETGDTDIDIDVFLNADISEGSNMKFEGLVNIGSKAGKTLEFSYIDNTAYLYFSKNSLKLSGSSIGDIVDFVKEFITPAEGESGEVSTETQTEASGSDAINSLFDTNELMQKLMASLENVVETELEGGGKELALSVEGLADLKVNIDSEERPTRAVVKTEEIAGVKLSAEVNIGFTDYIIVSNPELMHPERDYVEAGKVLELVKDTIKTKGLTLDISAAFDGKDLGANLVFDFETKNLFVRAQDKYSLGYLEGDIFADIDGAKIKIAKSLIDAFPDMKGDISKLVGKENFNLEDIGKLTGKLSSLDLLKVLACISDINSSSSGITIILDGEPININGQVRAFVGIEDGKISSVNVGGTLEDKAFELDIKVSTSASEIEIDKDSYLDIEKLISVNKDYFAGKQFALDFALELGGKEDVSFAGTLTAKLDTNYFDLSVSTSYKAGYRADIVYNGEMLYASLNNIMVKLPQSAISELLDKFLPKDKLDVDGIKDKLAERAQDIDIKTLIEKIKYIREFKVTSDGLKLVLSGEAFDVDAEVCLEIGLSGNMLSLVDVSYTSASGEFVHLTANVLSGEIKEKAVDEGKYLDLDAVYNNLKALDLRKGRVSAIASATYNGKDYDLGLNFAGSLDSSRATLVLDLGGEYDINLEVDYFNDDAYIRLGDIYVKVPKDLAKKLLSMASLPEKDKITEKVKESDLYKAILDKFNNFDISMLEYVKDVKVNSSLIEATIGSELTGLKQDVVVFVRLSNNQISGIEVVNFSAENLDLYLKASISFDEPTFRTIDQSKYLDLYPIYDEIDRLLSGGDINIADYLKNNSLAIDFALDLGGNENMSFEGSLSANLDTNYFDISAKTSYKSGYDAQLVLKGGVLYASLNNIMVKLPQSAISELLDKYLPKDKLDINGIKDKLTEQTSSLDAKAIIEILKSVKKLEISSDGLKLTVDGAMFNKDAEVTIAVTLCAGSLTHLDISYVENNATSVHLAVDFLDGEVKEKSVDENEYLDINEVYENLKSLGLRKGSVSLGTNFNYDGKSYSASVNFAGSLDSSRASLVFNLGGAYRLKLEIDYFNDDAFVRVGDAYIKVPKELIEKLLSSVTLPEKGELTESLKSSDIYKSLAEKFANFDISMLEYIKDVKVNSKEIQLTLGKQLTGLRQDVTLVISLKDNQIAGIEVKNFASEKLSMYLKATIDFNEPTFRTIDQSKYLDLDALYSGIENLLNSKDTGLVGYVDLGIKDKFSGRLNIELAKKLRETGLMGYMNIGLTSGKNNLSLQTNFFDNTLFASFQGLNIKIGANDISGAVKNICEAFNIDYEKCSGIVTSIEALLGGKGLISALSGYTFNTKLPKVDTSNLKFDLAQIVDILSGITINSKQINMTLDGALLGLEGTITLVIDLNDNNMITRAYLSGLNYKEYSLGCDLHLDYSEQTIPTFEVEEREKYIDLYGLSEAIKPVYDTIKEGSISGEFTLEFEYKGETNPLQVKYGVKLDKSGLTGFIQTEFKGLNINIYYIDKTLYFDIVGLKVYLNTTDFDEFKERLGIKDDGKTDETIENFKALVNAKTINEFIDALAKIDLGFVESAVFTSGNIDAKFRGNVQIGVTYGEKVERLTLNAKGVKVELACTSFDEVTIDTLDTTKFEPYTILFDTYDNIKTTLAQKQFSAHVSASSYVEKAVKDQASVNLNLDITNGINANGDITVSGNTNMYLTFGYQDDTLFAKYGNMKLKIQRSGLASLLAIALDLVGIDPGTVLGDDYSDVNINSDAIKEIIPDFDMGNPLNLLYLIKSIDIEDGAFIIVLNGSRINTKSGKDMTLKFKTDKTGVTEVDLLNIYTSADSNEYFNFVLTFGEFAGVEAIEDNGYIDITSSPDLIQGLINTYDLKEWNIKGTVALAIFNFEGLINVDVEAQIKIVDKKPVIAIEITNFPLVNVFGYGTDANTNGTGLSRKRTISIYYKDGYCYLKTYDPKVDALLSANRHAELVRETKVPYTEVFNNIEHYLQWLFGFSSAIMTKIHDAIEVSKSQPIDVSNLLNDYSFDGKTHTIAVNMEAITHDPNVGTLSVSFETVDKSSQGERAKHYVSKLGIDLSLVGILDVKTTKDSPLNVQFDTPTDFTAMEKYISEFNSTKTPYKDYWTEGGDKSLKNGDNKYNVVLNKDNGEAEQNITGVVGDLVTTNTYEDSREKIVLADLETKIVDDGITVKYYDFEGWYYENGEKFVEEYLTNNLKLVAHWKLSGERRYYFVTLKDEVTGENRTEKVLEGDSVNLKTLAKASHDDTENGRKVRKDYTFVGWQDSEGNVYSGNMTMPSADITLTADWNIRVRKYLTITFNTVLPQSSKAPITALEGDIITLDKMPNHSYEEDGTYFEYAFEYWKTEAGEEVSSVTLVSDITLIAKWSDEPVDTYKQRLLSVYSVDASGTSKLAWSGLQKVGARYPIEFVSALNIKDTTRLYKSYSDSTKKYADLFEKDADGRYIMPDQNLSLYMCNQFTITFTAKENKFDFTLTATLYQGDDINLNDILNYAGSNQDLLAVKTAITSNAKVYDTKNVDYYDYKFLGWNYDGSAFMAQVMLGKDFTLEANFDEGYKAYFKVYFDLVWYAPDGFSGDGSGGTGPTEVTPGNTLYVLQGESFDPSLYNSQRTRRFSWPSPNGTFKFNCTWSTTPPYTTSWFGAKSYDKNSVTPATKIDSMQGDLTLYPVWHRI